MNESGNNEVRKEQSLNSNNQDPLKRIVLSQIGTESQSSIKGRSSSTSNALYVPWKNGSLYENGYISKLSHSGELQWRKQIADVNQITTCLLYTSPSPRDPM